MRNVDTLFCFDHGQFYEPDRAWDVSLNTTLNVNPGRARARQAEMISLPWSEEERHEWETWREGDPLPEWAW